MQMQNASRLFFFINKIRNVCSAKLALGYDSILPVIRVDYINIQDESRRSR